MDWYSLSRQWFDWSFENPEKISPNHSALYFFAIEHCNRLWWRKKFWFPTEMAKDAIGIKSYHTYINTFNDLVEWGFIEVIERSKNQYSANIIALANFDKANDNALDKAIWKHLSKQQQSSWQSKSTIIKQIPTIEPENQETREQDISKDIWSKDLIPLEKKDNRNIWTQRIIDMIKDQVEQEWFLYDNNKEERNRATIISKRQSDWWLFIKDTPDEREEEIIRSIISYSNQNEYSAKIRSVKDFHEKWKKVANTMKQENKNEQEISYIPTY